MFHNKKSTYSSRNDYLILLTLINRFKCRITFFSSLVCEKILLEKDLLDEKGYTFFNFNFSEFCYWAEISGEEIHSPCISYLTFIFKKRRTQKKIPLGIDLSLILGRIECAKGDQYVCVQMCVYARTLF